MNILFLTAQYYPQRGGVQKHVYELSQELLKKGHQVTIITEAVDDSAGIRIEHDLEIHALDFGPWGFAKKFRIWWQMLKLRKLFKQADVIHCHDVFFWYVPLRFLLPLKKVFTTFHGYETVFPPHKKAILIRRLSNVLSRGSINIGDYIEKWYGTRSDMTLYGGISHVSLNLDSHKRKRKKVYITLIGRLADDIGIQIYLSVLQLFDKNKIPYELHVCGDGPLTSSLNKYGTVHGIVEDVEQYIIQADIIFASSYLTILEALAYGKRVYAVYEHALKEDYLKLAPFAEWMTIAESAQDMYREIMQHKKASFQNPHTHDIRSYLEMITWDKVADTYIALWKK